MLKKSLIAIAVLAIAMPAMAGSVKIHADKWPFTYTPVKVATIDVILDVGYFVHIKDQDPIKVLQTTDWQTYYGCKTTDVVSNFDAQLSVSATGVSAAGGDWSATLTPDQVPAGTTSVDICVSGEKVNIGNLVGGAKDVKVAEVCIEVIPVSF